MNYQESLMNFIINFFSLFASALALFLASLYNKFFLSFYSFSEAERFFIFYTIYHLGLQILIFKTSGFQIPMNCGRDTLRPYRLHRHSCRGIV